MGRRLLSCWFSLCALCLCGSSLWADPPVASYIFPPGGRRGTTVDFRVGGLFLHKTCSFEMLGPGVTAVKQLQRTQTVWFEGPLLPLPDSQQAEDYPKDMAGHVDLATDAPLGERFWHVWNGQGATPALKFVVGDLPEVIEAETAGDPVPVPVSLPVTINGRIFPREDIDVWSFDLHKGQAVCAEVSAARLGSPLDSHLEILDPQGRVIAENDDTFGADSFVRFTAAADGKYAARIHDINARGGQAYVYRLTVTADPRVDRVYPLGGRRGGTVKFELAGHGIPVEPVAIALPADGPRDNAQRLTLGDRSTNTFLLDLDDLPEYQESEPNDDPAAVKPLPLPAMANGRIDRPGDVDYWALSAHKGDVFEFELRAGRLGSPLRGALALCDSTGKELARAEGTGPALDPLLRFTAPADGHYFVRVTDQFRSRGGPEYAYRLRMAHPPPPDFRLQLAADVLTLPRGGQAKLKVQVERVGGHAEPIAVTVEGLPASVSVQPITLAPNQKEVEITFKAENAAAVQVVRLAVKGSAKTGNEVVIHPATLPASRGGVELDQVLLAVAMPTPFKVIGDYDMRWAPRGTVHHRHYRIERGGFEGPIEVSLADRQVRHLQGVTGPTIIVPPGASEFDYAVQLPPWMETGRTCRVCVMATGVVKEADGSEHVVSFSSVQQNEQIVAVIEPGRLGVEAERTSVTAEAGQTATVPVRIARGKGLAGPVKVEVLIAPHLRGIMIDPVEVRAEEDRATQAIRFAAGARGPFNMPLVIRATLTDKGEPVVAETSLVILPEP
jgi:hypothetical protein